jgi:hypothetical protein
VFPTGGSGHTCIGEEVSLHSAEGRLKRCWIFLFSSLRTALLASQRCQTLTIHLEVLGIAYCRSIRNWRKADNSLPWQNMEFDLRYTRSGNSNTGQFVPACLFLSG